MDTREKIFHARDELTQEEILKLVEEIRTSPDLARDLYGEAVVDQLLSLSLNPRRRDFVEQVLERLPEPEAERFPVRAAEHRRARLRVPVRPWGWWVTAVAASILVLLGVYVHRALQQLAVRAELGPSLGVVARVQGAPLLERGGARRPLVPDEPVFARDRLLSQGPGTEVSIRYRDASEIRLGPESVLVFAARGPPPGKRLSLDRGVLTAHITPQPQGAPMCLDTPHAEIRVVGTEFVTAAGADSTRIDMTEGEVRVRNKRSGEFADLKAGYYAVVGARTVVAARPAVGAPAFPSDRVRAGVQVLYTFEEGGGSLVRDVAGVGLPLDLVIDDVTAAQWLPGGGLALRKPTIIASRGPARKITAACRASGELTLEAWIRPASTQQGTMGGPIGQVRIVTLSQDYGAPNFMLGQVLDTYHLRFLIGRQAREEELTVTTLRKTVTTRLTHVVWTRDSSGAMRCYLDGREADAAHYSGPRSGSATPGPGPVTVPGDFGAWREHFRLALGDEFLRERAWLGEFHLVAVYGRALSADEVARNHRAGLVRARRAAK
ncbi:MAG: FecR domain-containing protein [Kiritimatiellae bacterium]|nr:FecR domain-containing protein [Kiritimatiellia bacterium]